MPLSSRSQAIADALAALDGFPHLRGGRVQLRGPRADDADALLAMFSDPQVMRYWSRPPMQSREEALALIEEIVEGFERRAMLNWVIADHDDAVVGSCTLFRFDPRHRRAELGFALHRSQWGRGLAREATTLALDWAFGTLGLHRIDASIDPGNAASRTLLLRLGFMVEGCQRESFFVGDTVTDTELLGLLASERQGPASRRR